ncbi:Ribosomal protein L14b/L23e [Ascosphaera apis ARSEF 7405]|uniref:Ribosomal protein L14b/L23e n=1 Tax=Ascosphaera apis ARSEF 7405 TaxID=392613 RepID=A0A167VWC4_9EURO|nr:Ribosomal protein L14b/L23e [Ascosphaera apis ARSEF 7405]
MVNCIDNSGAAVVECVSVLKKKKAATIGVPFPPLSRFQISNNPLLNDTSPGDRIICVVQKQRNLGLEGASGIANKVRRGDVRHAVVVRTRAKVNRPDGTTVTFGDNACVLINKTGDPIGTRLSGLVGKELQQKGWSKILTLAPMHL